MNHIIELNKTRIAFVEVRLALIRLVPGTYISVTTRFVIRPYSQFLLSLSEADAKEFVSDFESLQNLKRRETLKETDDFCFAEVDRICKRWGFQCITWEPEYPHASN